jgi:hypothetical protein
MEAALFKKGFSCPVQLLPRKATGGIGAHKNPNRTGHCGATAFEEPTKGEIVCEHQWLKSPLLGQNEDLGVGRLKMKRFDCWWQTEASRQNGEFETGFLKCSLIYPPLFQFLPD